MKRSPGFRTLTLAACAVTLSACGRSGEPVTGVFGYPWGTTLDSVLADSAQIHERLSGSGFSIRREPGRLYLNSVQFGLGYADLRLDFDSAGALWHGVVRVAADRDQADSIRSDWHKKHGRETSSHRIDTDSGYTTFWATGATVDRHYVAPTQPARAPEGVRALEIFHGGCLSGCPLYSVRLLPDGRALFLGVREVDPLGGYAGVWPAERWQELASRAASSDVWMLESEFSPTADGGEPRRGMATLLSDGMRRTWTSSGESAPPALETLLASLDSIAGGVVWDRPVFLWDTLDVRAVGWLDLDSLEQLSAR